MNPVYSRMIPVDRPRLLVEKKVSLARQIEKSHRTLKVTSLICCLACKGSLRLPLLEQVQNLPICYIAHLKVLLDGNALLIADSSFPLGHQGTTSVIRQAHIAIDPTPPLIAATVFVRSQLPIGTLSEGSAFWLGTVRRTESRRTDTVPRELVTGRVLQALMSVQLAIEAWWAFGWAIIPD